LHTKYPKLTSKRFQADARLELVHIIKVWHAIIPLPIALVGLILTLIYMYAVFKAIAQKRVSRKCYALMLNRAGGDVFACVTALTISFYVLAVDKLE
jgi:uncharacterized membrane protein